MTASKAAVSVVAPPAVCGVSSACPRALIEMKATLLARKMPTPSAF